jgi:hypothetical protein
MKKDSQKTIRSRSKRTFAGLPLIDVALGPAPDFDEPHGKAHGIIALVTKRAAGSRWVARLADTSLSAVTLAASWPSAAKQWELSH